VALSKSLQFTSDTKQHNLVPAKGVLCSLISVWSCITDCGVPSYRLGGMWQRDLQPNFIIALFAYKATLMLPSYWQNLLSDHHSVLQLRSSSAHLFSSPVVTCSHHKPFLYLSQPHGTYSNVTYVLLNLSLSAHCSLQLMAAWNSTVQSHLTLLICSLFATWVLYKSDIILYLLLLLWTIILCEHWCRSEVKNGE